MGTGLRNPMRRLAYKVRAIPGKLGFRPYTVWLEVSVSAGAELGEGARTTTTTQITEADGQPPRVRWLTNQELSLGNYRDGTIEIGPITPDFPGGGHAISSLHPDPSVNTTVRWVLYGPHMAATGSRFRVRDFKTDKTLSYLVRVESAEP